MEVRRAPIVWPGNMKKTRPRVKRVVPLVHRVITRTRQTCQRVNNAHVGMLNRRLSKRRVLNAAPVNSMTFWVLFGASRVQIRRTLVKKEETAAASIVQVVGRPTTAVRNVSRAVRERLALGVKIAR
jgi:hypothetical protein